MTYDTMKAEVTITVTKEGQYVLKATNTLPSDTEFNNTFSHLLLHKLNSLTKKLEGKELTKDVSHPNKLENGGNIIQTKKNAADGTIQFDDSYDKEGSHTHCT